MNYRSTFEEFCDRLQELGESRVEERLGASSGELTYNQAKKQYGKFFTDAAAAKLIPCRIVPGAKDRHMYLRNDIIKLRLQQTAPAELINL